MTPNRHGSAVVEFPNDLEIVTTREFDAPLELVFDVLTKPEHVSKWFAPFACEVTECSIDLARWGELPHGLRDRKTEPNARFGAPTWRSSRRPGPSRRGCSKVARLKE